VKPLVHMRPGTLDWYIHEYAADGVGSKDVYAGLACEDLGSTLSEQGFDATLYPYRFRVHVFRRVGLFVAKRRGVRTPGPA
jgi:hypothetical protein